MFERSPRRGDRASVGCSFSALVFQQRARVARSAGPDASASHSCARNELCVLRLARLHRRLRAVSARPARGDRGVGRMPDPRDIVLGSLDVGRQLDDLPFVLAMARTCSWVSRSSTLLHKLSLPTVPSSLIVRIVLERGNALAVGSFSRRSRAPARISAFGARSRWRSLLALPAFPVSLPFRRTVVSFVDGARKTGQLIRIRRRGDVSSSSLSFTLAGLGLMLL